VAIGVRGTIVAVLAATAALAVSCPRARAETSNQIWPEVDLFVQVDNRTRVQLLALSRIAPGSGFASVQAGGQLEFSIRPLQAYLFPTIQRSKKERATLAIGYRSGTPIAEGSLGGAQENRLLGEATFRLVLPGSILVSDRNRLEGRQLDGDWSWRYRNRLMLERGFNAGRVRLAPFASAELFYDSRYHAWNRLRAEAGVDIEELAGRGSVIELYLVRQLDDHARASPINAVGVSFQLHR
jgi:hypothetical protein